jgi:transposase
MGKSKTDAKETSQLLYFEGYTQRAIAKSLNVAEKTVNRWVKDGNWSRQRDSLTASKENRLSELYEELKQLNTWIKEVGYIEKKNGKLYHVANISQANVRRGLIKDIKDLENDYSIGEMIKIGIDFLKFLKSTENDGEDDPLSLKVKDAWDGFINQQLHNKKWQN